MAELAASLVVAPLVSLLKEKVYVQLTPGPVQRDGGQGEAPQDPHALAACHDRLHRRCRISRKKNVKIYSAKLVSLNLS